MDSSSFSDIQQTFPDAELLPVGGSTCDCYRVKLYGKFHFMKRLKPELRTDPRYVSALQKEFETGYRLDHPHLVHYVSKGEDYLLTEYVDGEDLKTFAANHPDYFKSRKNSERLISQLLDVVDYLHQHQIVHLDLKPENILVTHIGHNLKLTDLGYCYTDSFPDTTGYTNAYAAPEQLSTEKSKYSTQTDIYAIGKILQALPCAHIYNKVIARCTASDPSDRYQSVEELQRALKPSSRPMMIVMAVLLGIAMLIGLYFVLQKNEPKQDAQPQVVEQPTTSEDILEKAEIRGSVQPAKPETHENVPSSRTKKLSDSEQLRNDIEAAVLPIFRATIGALPDSVRPGTEQWAQAGRALERELSNTLQELILSHQDIPMQTVAQEYNTYLQSLITLKYNQNSQTP